MLARFIAQLGNLRLRGIRFEQGMVNVLGDILRDAAQPQRGAEARCSVL